MVQCAVLIHVQSEHELASRQTWTCSRRRGTCHRHLRHCSHVIYRSASWKVGSRSRSRHSSSSIPSSLTRRADPTPSGITDSSSTNNSVAEHRHRWLHRRCECQRGTSAVGISASPPTNYIPGQCTDLHSNYHQQRTTIDLTGIQLDDVLSSAAGVNNGGSWYCTPTLTGSCGSLPTGPTTFGAGTANFAGTTT